MEVERYFKVFALDLHLGIVGLKETIHGNDAPLILPTVPVHEMVKELFGFGVESPKGSWVLKIFRIIFLLFLGGHDAPHGGQKVVGLFLAQGPHHGMAPTIGMEINEFQVGVDVTVHGLDGKEFLQLLPFPGLSGRVAHLEVGLCCIKIVKIVKVLKPIPAFCNFGYIPNNRK
jgi:hypothetical protein